MERNEYRAMFSKLHTSIQEEELIMQTKHTNKRRPLALLLAAALVLALTVGAAAVYGSQIRDLVLRSPASDAETLEPGTTPESQSYDPLPGGVDMISLQGYADSPEYRAALDWAEFQHGYDRDGEDLRKVGNKPTGFEEKYSHNGYFVYTQAMADKVDEIAAQYGMALHTGGSQGATVAELEARFGDFLSTSQYGGYFYEDGSFQCDCEQDGVAFQLRRCVKGVLDTVALNIIDAAQYEQWEYDTACGASVLLALGPKKALIVADRPGSFVTVNVLAGTDTAEGLDAEALEALADSIDFSLL